jgi:hypothetical protein
MIDPKPCGQMLGIAPQVMAPFDEIIALGYYDGPTDGILHCRGCNQEFYFEMLDSRFDLPEEDETRIFSLSPIAEGTLAKFTAAMSKYQQPSWPFWRPTWSFPSEQERDEMNALVDRVMDRKGSVEWVVASSSWLSGEILAARPVSIDEFDQENHWFSFLGVT